MFNDIFEKTAVTVMKKYIEFVYNTSNVRICGNKDIFKKNSEERVVALFWHGDSYCLYPALRGSDMYIITTKDRRGDYISDICSYFGYKTIKVPDASDGGQYIFKIGKTIAEGDVSNIAISADGPLGPYHVPKDFAIATAALTKRKLLPITIDVRRKIELKKRWDDFKIPLPFNEITIHLNEPIEVTREDRKEKFSTLKKNIRIIMETKRETVQDLIYLTKQQSKW
ncbi:lysophospholipid acyltransferase family protein [Parasporobacterium paucivorans]|uniref:DUF374 domain-containing protein n=1 Tax=Parasporobacterium paucivorans DSM 15970 TaxID=1122934 RepID=A0A1M6D325_9FIRM|nr:DUF374 domain-containing protein [Parasporobacterium paucivorans]SHI67646.1 hypothetical protein SAMN02745691_00656 [Parasporobacterium paucivorans DSM 15970]